VATGNFSPNKQFRKKTATKDSWNRNELNTTPSSVILFFS
jgi:hypothetical protein